MQLHKCSNPLLAASPFYQSASALISMGPEHFSYSPLFSQTVLKSELTIPFRESPINAKKHRPPGGRKKIALTTLRCTYNKHIHFPSRSDIAPLISFVHLCLAVTGVD